MIPRVALLLACLVLCVTAAVVAHHLRDHDLDPRDFYSAVKTQLDELRSSDFQGAYQHAASQAQRQLTASEFERIVRQDCQRLCQDGVVEFGALAIEGRSALLRVFFVNSDQRITPCIYSFAREQGIWKIERVSLESALPSHCYLGELRL